MQHAYNMGIIQALNTVGITKIANPQLAAEIAGGAEPQELQALADSKITEKDIESAAKIVQVMAEMKQQADEAGMLPATPQGQTGTSTNTSA